MKKNFLFVLFTLISLVAYSQDIEISFYQGGVLCEGRTVTNSNKYILGCQNMVCTFDASFGSGNNGTVIMNVFNPNVRGFVPATYYIYPNNTLDVYVNRQHIASGRWTTINVSGHTSRGNAKDCPKCYVPGSCPICQGRGYFVAMGSGEKRACNTCKGTGKCPKCGGSGKIK